MLTIVACKTAKPREREYKMTDGEGMYLLVMPSGFKSWRLKYRFAGKARHCLGVWSHGLMV